VKEIFIQQPIFRFRTENFDKHKKELLSQIEAIGQHSLINEYCKITNTDWGISNDVERPYKNTLVTILNKHFAELRQKMSYTASVDNFWFQQYEKGDYHRLHNHSGCNYGSVFYLELPKNMQTVFYKTPRMEEAFQVDVQEGDFLMFPSQLIHESVPNTSEHRKTIISININADLN